MKSEDYCQGGAFQVEKRTVFSSQWLPLCAEGQVPKPGDFLSASVGGWGVVAVRDPSGALRVLRNACRHQNMPVVGTPSGNCETFRCRFHGWTYGLDGKFLSAPPPMAPPASQTDRDLLSLAASTMSGLVFFSMERPAQAPRLGSGLPTHASTVVTDIDCNWKVCVEHLLGAGETFTWPLLFTRKSATGAIVHQVVPHTFLRTRLFTHAFGDGAAGPADDSIKQACEELQAARAAGTMPAASDFHARLAAAYGSS